MTRTALLGRALLGVFVSTIVVACAGEQDTDTRAALERESLERELELALQPDTTQELTFEDVAVETPEEPARPPVTTRAPAPRPAPRPSPAAPQPAPRQETRAPVPAPAPVAPRVASYPVPAGTTFGVRLNEPLTTRTHPVGSTFTATLSEAIRAPDGSILIPAGATVRGQVTESDEAGRAGQDAYLGIEFTSITTGGRSYPIAGTALNVPVRLVTRDSRTEQVAKVGGGAAVGAVLGQIIGRNTRSTVAGAAIGAAAGTAVAIGTADVDATLDEGAEITVRVDRTINVER
ncbi:MAG: hypothetical protein WD737_13790 [Gemmatimonadota bacterium]